jgi:polyketide biosynthesis acyl carrier protein
VEKTEMLGLIAKCAREILPGLEEHEFVESDRLADLGANSVDRAEISMLVQESLSLQISRVELFGPRNIGELADLFVAKLHGA